MAFGSASTSVVTASTEKVVYFKVPLAAVTRPLAEYLVDPDDVKNLPPTFDKTKDALLFENVQWLGAQHMQILGKDIERVEVSATVVNNASS